MGKLAAPKEGTSKAGIKSGRYVARNPGKYLGNFNDIFYRSGLEKKFMYYCDMSPAIVGWGCEVIEIPYLDVSDKKHRYFPDFYLHVADLTTSEISYVVVEIKPQYQVIDEPPHVPVNVSESAARWYKRQLHDWQTNMMKWNYAEKYCISKGWQFMIIDEKAVMVLLGRLRDQTASISDIES